VQYGFLGLGGLINWVDRRKVSHHYVDFDPYFKAFFLRIFEKS